MNIQKVCQNCKLERDTTMRRDIHLPQYVGPCGDSFCYASCTMTTCRPATVTVCEECAVALSSKPRPVEKKKFKLWMQKTVLYCGDVEIEATSAEHAIEIAELHDIEPDYWDAAQSDIVVVEVEEI